MIALATVLALARTAAGFVGPSSSAVGRGRRLYSTVDSLRPVSLVEIPTIPSEEVEDRLTKSTRFLYPDKCDVMDQLEEHVGQMIDTGSLLKLEKAWQPMDYMPDPQRDDFIDRIVEMREQAAALPDELLVALVGDMITEEALPTYQTLLNTLEGVDDPTGTNPSAWGAWSRTWTAEENRHGDLLNRYLYNTGRVDMRAVEQTIHRLIANGFNPDTRKDPYCGFIYTSFQERATKISHGNVGKLAAKAGDASLSRICAIIAGDEARHEKAYTQFSRKIMECDPSGFLLSFKHMMTKQIVMPAELMDDGVNPNLFNDFSRLASGLGVYTGNHYAEIMKHLVETWKIDELSGLTPEAEEAQQFLLKLPARYSKLAQRGEKRLAKMEKVPFAWINGRVC